MRQNWHSCRSWWVEQKSQSQHRSIWYQTWENEFSKLTYYSGLLNPIGISILFGARFVRVWYRFELCHDWLFWSTSRDIQLCQIWSNLMTWPKSPIWMYWKIWPFDLHNFWPYGHSRKLCFTFYLLGSKNMSKKFGPNLRFRGSDQVVVKFNLNKYKNTSQVLQCTAYCSTEKVYLRDGDQW